MYEVDTRPGTRTGDCFDQVPDFFGNQIFCPIFALIVLRRTSFVRSTERDRDLFKLGFDGEKDVDKVRVKVTPRSLFNLLDGDFV